MWKPFPTINQFNIQIDLVVLKNYRLVYQKSDFNKVYIFLKGMLGVPCQGKEKPFFIV